MKASGGCLVISVSDLVGIRVFKEYSESVWRVDENLKKREFKD